MFYLLSSLALAVPTEMNHQGRLTDASGVGLQGTQVLTFRIHDAETGGNLQWSEVVAADFDNGYYSVLLGQNTILDTELFEQYPLWLEIQLGGGSPMTPRHEILSTPYSFVSEIAEVANSVEGYVDATEVAVNGTTVIDSSGNWVGPSISSSGVNPDWTDVQNRPSGLDDGDDDSFANISCSSGEGLAYNGSGWACVSLVGDFSDLSNIPSGLSDGDDDTLAGISCATGEIVEWSGSAWVCTTQSTGTTLTESDVENYVTNDPINLSSNSMMNGAILATQDDLSAMDWTDIQNRPVGLDDGDDDSFADISCGAGETISFDGSDWVCVSSTVDFADIANVPADLVDGDDDTLAALICAEGEVAVYSETVGGWICGPNGGASGSSIPNVIGESDGGEVYSNIDTTTPVAVPDNNFSGFTSALYISNSHTISTMSIDLNITHQEMGDLTVILTAPSGTAVTLLDGDFAGQADFNGNLGWDNPINGGDLYSFYGEDTVGTWTLQIIDNVASNIGTLDGWTVRFNEEWDGELFVGDNLIVQNTASVRGELRADYGADFVMTNTDGEETLRLDAESPQTIFTSANYASKVYTTTASVIFDWSTSYPSATAMCETGDIALSGSCGTCWENCGHQPHIVNDLPVGWNCSRYRSDVNVTAVCLDLTPE